MELLLYGTHQQLNKLADAYSSKEIGLKEAANNLSCATQLILQLIRYKFNLDEANYNLLTSLLSPIVDDNTDQGWEEATMASMEHLLRTSLAATAADTATVPYMRVPDDTVKLKKQIAYVCDRLAKGGKLIKPAAATNKKKAAEKTPPKKQ